MDVCAQNIVLTTIVLTTAQENDMHSPKPRVHEGFRLSAKALEGRVERQLGKCEYGTGPKEIVFTGHSAGAAVASLLFQIFLSVASAKCKPLLFLLKAIHY